MARFSVYPGPDGSLLLDCQADVLDHLNTRFVVPLMPPDSAPIAAARLNPLFEIESNPYVMYTQFAASVPANDLKLRIASLDDQSVSIMNALDMLITGY